MILLNNNNLIRLLISYVETDNNTKRLRIQVRDIKMDCLTRSNMSRCENKSWATYFYHIMT